MKKTLLLSLSLVMAAGTSFAAEDLPYIVNGLKSEVISANGNYVAGLTGPESVGVFNVETLELVNYILTYPGAGNYVSNNGWAVGNRLSGSILPVILRNGEVEVISSLVTSAYVETLINGITPDGSRLCGYYHLPEVYPFICDIAPDGTIGEAVRLPMPEKDFFGLKPQSVTAQFISDDGTVVSGMIVDYTGDVVYPIVYTQDAQGNWSYTLPSVDLFNPDHIEIPEMPVEPEAVEFMTEENREAYELADKNHWENPDEFPTPNVQNYMSEAEYEAYTEALEEYSKAYSQYREIINQVRATSPSFVENDMILDPTGRYLVSALREDVTPDGSLTTVWAYTLYAFDLEDGWSGAMQSAYNSIVPIQVLSDATIIGSGNGSNSYIYLEGTEDFQPIADYMETVNPEYGAWMKNRSSGRVAVTDDLGSLVGGCIGASYSYYSYIFADNIGIDVPDDPTTGIEALENNGETLFDVYSLQGLKVLKSAGSQEVRSLPRGLYIVNGKKTVIK